MIKPLIIPCRFNTEETKMLEKMEMEYSPDLFDTRDVYFYKIDAVYESAETYKGVTKPVTVICSGGLCYETKMGLYELLKLINE